MYRPASAASRGDRTGRTVGRLCVAAFALALPIEIASSISGNRTGLLAGLALAVVGFGLLLATIVRTRTRHDDDPTSRGSSSRRSPQESHAEKMRRLNKAWRP